MLLYGDIDDYETSLKKLNEMIEEAYSMKIKLNSRRRRLLAGEDVLHTEGINDEVVNILTEEAKKIGLL